MFSHFESGKSPFTLNLPKITFNSGDALYIIRLRKGMASREFAKLLGISHTQLLKYEHGECPSEILINFL